MPMLGHSLSFRGDGRVNGGRCFIICGKDLDIHRLFFSGNFILRRLPSVRLELSRPGYFDHYECFIANPSTRANHVQAKIPSLVTITWCVQHVPCFVIFNLLTRGDNDPMCSSSEPWTWKIPTLYMWKRSLKYIVRFCPVKLSDHSFTERLCRQQ